ncbi:hypothetical protein APHAL10511_002967 [Amanita phalloides]|nr:hypothetical protein APHAL10511_002967 [Amanita phalloides]
MATSAPSLSRTSSAASISSTDDAAASNFSQVIRRTRKRFTSAQLAMLENLFHRNSHPSREEREGVAKVGGMEVKSVTIWFQNKRQTERRVALLNSDTLVSTTSLVTIKGPQPSAPTHSPSSSRPCLDRVASRTELRTLAPRTPTRRRSPRANLWDNMPSSPITSPISPPPLEYLELAKNQRVKRTLEWACAAARLAEKEGISVSSFSHPQPPRMRAKAHQHRHHRLHHQHQDHILARAQAQAATQAQCRHNHPAKTDADLTEEESDELVTPPGSWVQEEDQWIARPDGAMQAAVVSVAASKCTSQGVRAQEDDVMRAALALCGLGRRSSA